jgi:phosphoribosylformimino-5-aminoimidazole carboxamide ribotide isomerase
MTANALLPAIDLRGGAVVRLLHGDYSAETRYGDDPVAVAEDFADQGAEWVHIVDLDAARGDGPVNRAAIGRVADRLASRGVRVQTGGGVRAVTDARQLADLGVARVVMGSAAVRSPELVDEVAATVSVAVGLDHRDGQVAVDGWTRESDLDLHTALAAFPSAEAFVVTDISRDGALVGPDLVGLSVAARATDRPVIASGGVATLDDLSALAAIPRLGGVIVGRALYEGRFTVAEAIAVLERGA